MSEELVERTSRFVVEQEAAAKREAEILARNLPLLDEKGDE